MGPLSGQAVSPRPTHGRDVAAQTETTHNKRYRKSNLYRFDEKEQIHATYGWTRPGGSAHMVSWGWLLDVGGGGNRTGGIGGLVQCAGATGAVRSTFVGLGGLGLARGCSAVADASEPG